MVKKTHTHTDTFIHVPHVTTANRNMKKKCLKFSEYDMIKRDKPHKTHLKSKMSPSNLLLG